MYLYFLSSFNSNTVPRSSALHPPFQVDMAQENFEKISRIIRKEFEAFDIKKCQDFKQTILQYLEQMLK